MTLSWKPKTGGSWTTITQATKNGAAWSGAVTTSGGRSTTGELLWNAIAEPRGTGTLEAPAVISLTACFHYPSAADKCTNAYQHTVQLVPSAFGGTYPVADLGPASLALYTGEVSIRGIDAADSAAGIVRTFSSFDDATLTSGIFGPGWSDPALLSPNSDTEASIVDNRSSDGSIVVVGSDSGAQMFVPHGSSTTDFLPLVPTGDATKLTFTAGTAGAPDKLDLDRPLGSGISRTSWALKASDTGTDPAWTVEAVDAPGGAADVAVTSTGQRPTFIRESDPSASSTCTATTQTAGCRALKVTYTGSGAATRVASIARLIGAAAQPNVVTKTLASYGYNGSGQLTSVCSAAPAAGKPTLCTTYAYVTVAGRTLLSEAEPAGLKKWRFSYDAAGRLTTVKREKPAGGDATWSADYSLTPCTTPTSCSSSGLPNIGASAAAEWGQQIVPTRVFAVYEPYTGSASTSKAHLYFTTTEGTVTNTADYGPSGWLVDTSWYDAKGQVVRHLDGAGWSRTQQASPGDRPRVAAEASSYTVFNTWGDADTVDTRVVDQYGPAVTSTLRDGTSGLFRTHTHTMYDDDPNVDSALIATRPGSNGLGLVVKETTSVSDVARTSDYDVTVKKYGYAPIVVGDGNGWVLGSPTTIATQVNGSSWSTLTARYDSAGRGIESRQPGGAADSSGAGSDAHSTVTTRYTAGGSGDCGGKPEWEGQICKVGPAAQPTGLSVPTTFNAAFNDDLQPTNVQEISGGTVTRTTATTYDDLGRVTGVTKTTAGSGVANESISTAYGYDDNTGLATTISTGGETVTKGYDSWGRESSSTDAVGTSSTTTYDGAGNVASINDGSATYVYTRDDRGTLTAVDGGGGVGTFSYSYTNLGLLDTVTYPNGVVAKRNYDEGGGEIGLAYSQGSSTLLAFAETHAADGRTIAQSSPASEQQFAFDSLGRLTGVEDTRSTGCTTRDYGYDDSSNRNSLTTYAPGAAGACQSVSPSTTRTNSYDSAGRIRNSGYLYDTLGRTLTTPQEDGGLSAAGDLTATYRANDRIASLSQTVTNAVGGTDSMAMNYDLDPVGRVERVTTVKNGSESKRLRYRYAGSGDFPSQVDLSSDGGSTWSSTRYVVMPSLGMTASVEGGASSIQIANLHGDIVASVANSFGASTIASYTETDEFGKALTSTDQARFGWLGAHARSRDALGGLTLMGARLYNPSTGMFLQSDPVQDGGATRYAYPYDPVNMVDLDGHVWGIVKAVGKSLKWVGEKALIPALKWGLERIVSRFVCGPVAGILCEAMIAGMIDAGAWLFENVFKRHRSVEDSVGPAMIVGVNGFLESIAGYGLGLKHIKKIVEPLKGFRAKVAGFLHDSGHRYTAYGFYKLVNEFIDRLLVRFGGRPMNSC